MTVVGYVSLDGFARQVAQYDPEVRWNGWLCPQFDALGAVAVLEAINADSPSDPPYWYDFIDGVLHVRDRYDESGEFETYEPDDDGLYSLGSYAWVWSAAEPPLEPVRNLRAVPDPPG